MSSVFIVMSNTEWEPESVWTTRNAAQARIYELDPDARGDDCDLFVYEAEVNE